MAGFQRRRGPILTKFSKGLPGKTINGKTTRIKAMPAKATPIRAGQANPHNLARESSKRPGADADLACLENVKNGRLDRADDAPTVAALQKNQNPWGKPAFAALPARAAWFNRF